MGFARLSAYVLECPDPKALADFYQQLTDWKTAAVEDDWVTLSDGAVQLSFQRAPGHKPPNWPDSGSSMQTHIDFVVDDLDDAETQALTLGARKFDHQPGTSFRVFADPVGHPFCLCV